MNKYKINTTMAFEEELQFIYEYIANRYKNSHQNRQIADVSFLFM